MKTLLHIPSAVGFCKNCYRLKRHGSAYCGECQDEPPRMPIYQDERHKFPLFKQAQKKFKVTLGTIFTYDDTIYTGNDLPFHLIAHEITHVFQQQKIGADEWWKKYFADKKFRLKQELEAYHNQYECQKRLDVAKADILLNSLAQDLSSELYGEIIDFYEAKEQIARGTN